MARKIRFALDMENGVEVRTLEELKENFSLEKVLLHIASGKLVTWLRDRYLDDIAEKIETLETSDSDYNKKICEIFDVVYDEASNTNYEKAEEHNRKLSLLKAVSDEQEYIDNVDKVAFEQDDIYDLLDAGETTIYLCGEKFSIPLSKCGIKYIGINKPVVVIDSKEPVDWETKKISLKNVIFDEKYKAVEITKQNILPIIVIEINDYFVRLLKWNINNDIVSIEKVAERRLAKGSIEGGKICNSLGIEGAIKDIIDGEGITDKNVCLCLDSSEFINKILTVHSLPENNIADENKYGSRDIMRDYTDYIISYKIISTGKDEYYRPIYNIWITAIPKKILETYREIFEKIGLSIVRCYSSFDSLKSLLVSESHYQEHAPLMLACIEDEAIRVTYLSDVWSFCEYSLFKYLNLGAMLCEYMSRIYITASTINISPAFKSIFLMCDKSDYDSLAEDISRSSFHANAYWLPSLNSSKIQVDIELEKKYICALGAITLIMDKNNTQDLINNNIILSKEDMLQLQKKVCCCCGSKYPPMNIKFCPRCGALFSDAK